MKKTLIVLISVLAINLPALAEDVHHPEKTNPPATSKATSPDQTMKAVSTTEEATPG